VAESAAGQQAGAAIRQALAEAAGYLALVTQNNPRGSADALLARPDTDAILTDALENAAEAAAVAVQQAWDLAGAPDSVVVTWLLEDIASIFAALAHLRGLIRHAHASVPREVFTRGVSAPGSNPDAEAARRRGEAVRDALLNWGTKAALRARMAISMAGGAGAASAVLADALDRESAGQHLSKRWVAHPERPTCCYWCRKLHGVTIPVRASFAPYLGVSRPGMRVPRLYHGELQGPLLHPFCSCRLEIASGSTGTVAVPGDGGEEPEVPGFLSASQIRDMPQEEYEAEVAFLRAAVHELDQVLGRLAEGSG
jgi:hypothetical protein